MLVNVCSISVCKLHIFFALLLNAVSIYPLDLFIIDTNLSLHLTFRLSSLKVLHMYFSRICESLQ